MQLIRLIVIALVACTLASCAKYGMSHNQKKYAQFGGQVHKAVAPQGVPPIKQQAYYAVPNRNVAPGASQVSLVPPGSRVLQAQTETKVKKTTYARAQGQSSWVKLKDGSPALMLSMNANQAWASVGKALHSSKIQVLDQDSSIKSYYVLDTSVTNNKVTQTTPIYRLYVKQLGNQSELSVVSQKNRAVNPAITTRILTAVQRQLT